MVSRRDQRCVFRAVCLAADQVYLAGDFNGWSVSATPMRRIGKDLWQVSLRLPPGEYRFRYVTDDQRWLTDFRASGVVQNVFGEWDSLLRVAEHHAPLRSESRARAALARIGPHTRHASSVA